MAIDARRYSKHHAWMKELPILHKKQVSSRLYYDLLTSIACGQFQPNKPMPTEECLANDYGIPRTIVREALAKLKNNGLVESVQGSGTIVIGFPADFRLEESSNYNVDDLIDCYECRLAIEPEIAAQVALRLDANANKYLKGHLRDLERDLENMRFHAPADAEFHIRLAGFSGNKMFQAIMESLRPHILFAMNISKTLSRGELESLARSSIEQHREICQAILNGDSETARTQMRLHISSGKAKIFKHH